jgi:hypothetical protein
MRHLRDSLSRELNTDNFDIRGTFDSNNMFDMLVLFI